MASADASVACQQRVDVAEKPFIAAALPQSDQVDLPTTALRLQFPPEESQFKYVYPLGGFVGAGVGEGVGEGVGGVGGGVGEGVGVGVGAGVCPFV